MSNELNKNNNGLRPQSMDELLRLAEMIAGSQLAPKDFKGKPEDIAVAMLMGAELGLNPMQSIQNIAVINGRPSIWGDALLALVQNNSAFKSIEESFNDSTMTASCTVTRKGGNPHTQTYSQEDAQTAGLWGGHTWKKYPKRMLQMRARGFALRNQFADALLGLISREEAEDTPKDEIEINPIDSSIPSSTIVELKLPEYEQSRFNEKYDWFKQQIKSGKSADELIAFVSTKFELSKEQKELIRSI